MTVIMTVIVLQCVVQTFFFGVWDSFLYGLNTQSNRAPLQEHMQGGSQTRNIRTDLA